MPYAHDVFISYRRKRASSTWVRDHLKPLLEQWLDEEIPGATVFFDDNRDDNGLAAGAFIPEAIPQHVRESKVMIRVWSAAYFQSRWCLSEWKSMAERQRTVAQPLVLPVVFQDGDSFPLEVSDYKSRNLKPFAFTCEAYRETKDYVAFEGEVKQLCVDLAAMIRKAPEWSAQFPWIDADPPRTTGQTVVPVLASAAPPP